MQLAYKVPRFIFFSALFRTRYYAHLAVGRLDQHQGCLAPAAEANYFPTCLRCHLDKAIEPGGGFLRSVKASVLIPRFMFFLVHIRFSALRKEACGSF